MISVTKCFEFEAAHHLPDYDGPCKNVHGHTYRLEVEVSGGLVNGMVMDFSELKRTVQETVITTHDHADLNEIYIYPSAERMVDFIAGVLMEEMPGHIQLERIRLWETSSSYAEWRR